MNDGRNMKTIKIHFDDSETSYSVASRIVYAFNIGNIIKVRDKFFKVVSIKHVTAISDSVVSNDNYTLVLPINQASEVSSTKQTEPERPVTKRVESVISEVQLDPSTDIQLTPKIGQRLKPKDPRRKSTFLIVDVDDSFVYSNDGRKVSVNRLHKYEIA